MKKIKVLLLVTFVLLFVPTINLKADIFVNVSGRLLDYDTGKGIPNASILIFPYHLVETDKDGKFVFNELPEDQYRIDIESTICSIHEFYVPYKYPENINVGRGINVGNVTIYLKKGLEISGRIFAEDGVTPITGAKISIGSKHTNYYGKIMSIYSHGPSLLSRLDFFSDDQGNFKIKGLLEKIPFNLYIEKNGFADEKISNNIVEYGVEPAKLNITMGKKGKAIAHGTVVSSIDNKPVSGVTIHFDGKKEIAGIYGTAVTDINGNFVLKGLPAGLYEINYFPAEVDWGKFELSIYMRLSMQVFENKENFIKIELLPKPILNTIQDKKKNDLISTNTLLYMTSYIIAHYTHF